MRVDGVDGARHPHRGRRPPRPRHRRAQAARPPAGRGGGAAGELLPLGAQRRQRRRLDDDPGGPRRRPVGAERPQGLDHQRRRLPRLHRLRQDRSRRRSPGISAFIVERDTAGRLGRQARAQDGPARLAHRRDRAGGRDRPGREPRRRRGPRLPLRPRVRSTGPGPSSRAQALGLAQGALDVAGALRARAPPVRPARRRLPGRPVHARRHGNPARSRPPVGLRRLRAASTPARPASSKGSSMAKLFATDTADARDDRRRPAPRRRGHDPRVPG